MKKHGKFVDEEELVNILRKLKLIKLADGRFDVIGDVDFSGLGLDSLLEIPVLLKDLCFEDFRIRKVTGDFHCENNNLQNLEGAPELVGGSFYCYWNKLVSFKGAPKYVGGDFWCSFNKLTSLEGAPEIVHGDFVCSFNNLTSLEGAPKHVGKDFSCSCNKLITLKGAPKEVGGNFYCNDNSKRFTEEEVRKLVNVKGIVIV